MMTKKYNYPAILMLIALMVLPYSCSRDLEELDLEEATNPPTAEVFIDGFSAGLNYAAFGGSNVEAFEVDDEIKYNGTSSMRIAVPDFEDPKGAYAGGVYFTDTGRDLSDYNALTFWARSSMPANIDLVGIGNDLGENKFQASVAGLAVNSNWKKYYIPIPDAAKLTNERGMFFYSEGPEDGRGYTLWFDDVQFENLGTIAHASASILDGADLTVTAETGATYELNPVTTFNLPSGINQDVITSAAYLTYTSTNPTVASVDDQGKVNVLDAGTALITATLGGIDVSGSLLIASTGDPVLPMETAPVPTVPAEDVISVFSNAYTDIPVDFYNGFWEFSTTDSEIIQVSGDDILRYTMLNFVGIQFTAPTIDVSEMTHFHIDLWTPDATDLPKAFKILLVDLGPDGSFEGGDNSSHELTFTSPTLTSESWISLDIPMSNFAGLTSRTMLAQIVLSGDLPNVFVDNMYFYDDGMGGGGGAPTTAAPDPTEDPANVISVFSDSYDNIPGTDLNPNWGQATIVTEESIEGNNTLKYTGLNYQGVQLGSPQDVSSMEFLHLDYWTDNSSALNTFLISSGPVETAYAMPVPTSGWNSVDIPLSDFAGVDLTDVIQMKFDGNGTIYLDNIFFYREGGTGGGVPDMAAPVPSEDAANVISVFSDSYDDIPGTDLNPDWGQATVVTQELIDGNNTLKYMDLNYQGVQLGSPQDVSSMEFLHLDYWTDNSSTLNTFLISSGPVETAYALTVPTSGWNSVNIPLSDFAGVDLVDVIQMKFDGNGTIYLDNIFFYREGGTGGGVPDMAAPVPSEDAANVISVFSDSYDDIPGTDLNPNWGQATIVTEELIDGNNTLKYMDLNYQGIQLGSPQDVSGMEFLHLDYWTDNSSALNTFLISSGPIETAYALTVPTSGWSSVDIPLSDFAGVDLADIIQMKFDGNGTIYLDNIFFYRTGGGATEPTTAAPAPTLPEANVISLFSDSYTDVAVDTWRTDWSSAVFEDVMIAGDPTKKYSELDFVGIETVSSQVDASSMTHFHIDVWSADFTLFAIKLVDFGADGAFGGGDDVEHQIDFTMPAQGEWISYDIPLSDFTGLTTSSNIAQYILVGQPTGMNTVFVDNVYFHN